jgi:hypothetical protein
VAVHFKGSGFYNTDYGTRRRQRELKESAEGTSKKDESSKSESKSESKPDSSASSAKTETKSPASKD